MVDGNTGPVAGAARHHEDDQSSSHDPRDDSRRVAISGGSRGPRPNNSRPERGYRHTITPLPLASIGCESPRPLNSNVGRNETRRYSEVKKRILLSVLLGTLLPLAVLGQQGPADLILLNG